MVAGVLLEHIQALVVVREPALTVAAGQGSAVAVGARAELAYLGQLVRGLDRDGACVEFGYLAA
jgi:hypothetical protein